MPTDRNGRGLTVAKQKARKKAICVTMRRGARREYAVQDEKTKNED
jgi:hypothetical protein